LYKRTKALSIEVSESGNTFNKYLIECVNFFKYLKATSAIHTYKKKLNATIHEIEEIHTKMGKISAILVGTRESFSIIIVAVVILVQVNVFGADLSSVLLSLLFFYRSLGTILSVQNTWNSFLNNSGAIHSIQQFNKELQSNREESGETEFPAFRENIQLSNLSYSYPGRGKVLNNINLDISRNETIAFVGDSGSGKTTLLNIIAGLYGDYEGSITIDGLDFRQLQKASYQRRLGYISQESVIFNDDIFNNVTLWSPKNEKTTAQFEHSINQSAIKDFLEGLPAKERTLLGNNGVLISGGQKQRINIARELFKDIDLILLDEATSALDSSTELEVQKNIDSLKGKYTVLIVAHRLSTVKNADKIIMLHNGRIEAFGSFRDLARTNARFQKMVNLQEF
jgi:subfamily B ATP-binding cassette protein MsbA